MAHDLVSKAEYFTISFCFDVFTHFIPDQESRLMLFKYILLLANCLGKR